MMNERVRTAVEDLAAALYRLQWDVDLYATPRGPEAKQYERRAKKLMAAGYYKKDVDALADQEAKEDVLARHRIDHRYDTALHEECTCGKRWMVGTGKLEAHHAEVLAATKPQQASSAPLCATCDGGGCGDCVV